MNKRTFMFALSVFIVFFTLGIGSRTPVELGALATFCAIWAFLDMMMLAADEDRANRT